jgi:tRNA (guanine-N7-)-methyltransferase
VIRAGRFTDSQRKALEQHWTRYVLDYQPQLLALDSLFPKQGPLTVEIGFGMGDSLLEMAQAEPNANFIGIEVHKPGIGKLLHGIAEHRLNNLLVICHDATEVLAHCFSERSVDKVLILFPDPWPKKRHHKRRIIQPAFLQLLASRLKPGGELHLATDWQEYAEHMLEVLEASEELVNANGAGNYWESPRRPATKFERRGKRLGHGVWDLLYYKSADQV